MVDRKIAFTLLFGYNQVLENLILLLVSQNLNHLRNIMREIVMLQEQIVENISVFLNTYYYESLLKIDRSVWMRERSCVWRETIVPQFEYEDWIENFRMSQQTFEYICSAVEKNLQPKFNPLKSREPVSVKKQVAIAIFTYASCCEFRVVGHLFGVHKATVWKCVHRVTKEINEVLMPIWITMPNEEECQLISEEFKKKTGMPCFIGAVDGSHIPITPPSVGYRDFINRKGYASFVLQGLVDHRSVFRNINIESPGCNHDANVFKHSALFIHYEQLICQARRLINGVSIPYLVMGVPAYPLLPWLIKGFTKHQELSAVEESFNAYLNSGRVSVEIAFGRLKGRWRRISKRIDCHYTFVPNMVSACCVLHNIVEHRQEKFNKQWDDRAKRNKVIFPDTTTEEDTEPEIQAGIPMGAIEDGKKIRNVLLKIVSELPLRKMLH